jgi:hypothetical protein
MERGRLKGQNFQPKNFQRLEEEKDIEGRYLLGLQ